MQKEVREELRIRRFGVILEYARRSGNIAKVCRELEVQRSSFYVWKKTFEKGCIAGLEGRNRSPIVIQENCHKKLLIRSLNLELLINLDLRESNGISNVIMELRYQNRLYTELSFVMVCAGCLRMHLDVPTILSGMLRKSPAITFR